MIIEQQNKNRQDLFQSSTKNLKEYFQKGTFLKHFKIVSIISVILSAGYLIIKIIIGDEITFSVAKFSLYVFFSPIVCYLTIILFVATSYYLLTRSINNFFESLVKNPTKYIIFILLNILFLFIFDRDVFFEFAKDGQFILGVIVLIFYPPLKIIDFLINLNKNPSSPVEKIKTFFRVAIAVNMMLIILFSIYAVLPMDIYEFLKFIIHLFHLT